MRLTTKCRHGGFTLIEIMLVIAIMTILLAIAWPNWTKARETASNRTCLANLRHIEIAKEQFAIEGRKTTDDAVAMADLVPAYLREMPDCPSSGEYTPNRIGTKPTCSISGHELP